MNIVLYQGWEEVEKHLRSSWNVLLRRSASDTFFLTWEWMASWWSAYGAGKEPFVMAAWQGDAIVGVAPLYSEPVRRCGRSWKRLRYIGDGSDDSDYLDYFAEIGKEQEVAEAFLGFLREQQDLWDYLELHGPLETSPFVKAISGELTNGRWGFAVDGVECLTLKLPATWENYLQSLKPRFRSKVRSALSFFEGSLKSLPVQCTTEEQLDAWLPIFFDLHGKRWRSKGKPGVFHGDAKRKFYAEMSRAALKAGVLSFHRLDWGERALAFQYGFSYNGGFLLLQEAYDPEFEHLRPGVALRAYRLREMIANGRMEYDFLAGVAQHKLDWGAQSKRAVKLSVASSASAAALFLKAPALRKQAKERLRKMIPEPVLALRQRLRSIRESENNGALDQPRSLKTALAGIYHSTPLRRVGKWVADRYEPGHRMFSLQTRRSPLCQIFLYHRVNDDRDPFLPSLPTKEFRRQMEYIARNFHVVTLDDIAEGRIGNEKSGYSVAVTFDDGYRDNFTSAFPILKELGIPATIYLATGYVGSNRIPWYDQVSLAFKLTVREQFKLGHSDAPSGPISSLKDRLALLDRVLDWLREMDDEARRRTLPGLFQALGVPPTLTLPNYMLSWDEIKQMKDNHIEFGAHTVNHPVLSRISGRQLQEEISLSKKTIEQKLKMEVRHFAYPFGRTSHFNNETKSWIEQCGFRTAVTTEYGFNAPGADPFTLKRFTPWGHDLASFVLQLDWFRFAGVDPSPEPSKLRAAQTATAEAN